MIILFSNQDRGTAETTCISVADIVEFIVIAAHHAKITKDKEDIENSVIINATVVSDFSSEI